MILGCCRGLTHFCVLRRVVGLRLPKNRPTLLPFFHVQRVQRASHSPEAAYTCTERKIHRVQVNNLILAAERLLETKNAHTIQSYLMSKISADKFYNPYRWVAFARLIRFALARQLFSVAIALYDRLLNEGFAPPSSIRARMTAIKLVDSSKRLEDVIAPLKQVFADESYDSAAFMQLLYFMLSVKKVPVPLVDNLARIYTTVGNIETCSCPDLVGEVVRISVQSGDMDAAQHWLRTFEESCRKMNVGIDAAPYANLLDSLMRVDPGNTSAMKAILEKMKAADIPPSISVFNTLIHVNVKQQRFREAFELYRVLMTQRSDQLMPNDVTFKTLLRATRLFSQKRRAKRPPNAVEPSQIFRDMLECHLQQTEGQPLGRSTSLSASGFQMALRSFIARNDYLGAFIVVRLLDIFGFSADLQSYRAVLAHLLSRIKREMESPRRPNEYRLTDFLMHLFPNEKPDLNDMLCRVQNNKLALQPSLEGPVASELLPKPGNPLASDPSTSVVEPDVVSHLVNLSEPNCHSDEDLFQVTPSTIIHSSARTRRRRPLYVPTLPVLMGDDAPPVNNRCSPTPLARLLQKAFLGVLWASSPSFNPCWHGLLQKVVGDAKKRMIPPMDGADSAKGAELRKHLSRKPPLPFAASRKRRSARAGWEIEFTGWDYNGM
ncbi:hypothetical protein BKA82DRAFT_992352 [Pisolithus tinctorius]|uniref:Pentacotripeptide-repeat region of PRORP domain-containing protein n=1 Tax=Pisolithus tinctorius Marx 270 TaxID=870435 RepID=A0A0C3KX41_PISTI|nr:hypothetical protein BKA82DRAFT_992352 [Pisolithus tinctorius]KIO14107.1 hypothetical protein M404DRAFT_992352 [Pisolithus tinctorius Marx 270]